MEAFGQVVDVSRPEEIRAFVEEVVKRFGGIDILVNNAAVNHSGTVATMTQDLYDEIFQTNVRGVFFSVQAAVPYLRVRQAGRIINIASFVARSPVPFFTAYSASKAAVISLTKGMALELAEHEINVNAVCPGNVWSDIWERSMTELSLATGKTAQELFTETIAHQPLQRPQTGEEIGAAVVYLCSDQAKNVTGEALYICGGL